ncbi:MAG TPA: endonuclease/exonuclease/phosphatase family protein [Terriglobales bacterium]|nr:endonuclease/exonuclease/phosphatase family protein [Terriglobales bacterium]
MLRIVSYNIHKCRGLDQRVRPARIAQVLRGLDADVIALQEVICGHGTDELEQARYIASHIGGYNFVFGENRKVGEAGYGNAVLSRLKILSAENYDLTAGDREKRGCLRADIELPGGQVLHLFNAHLGTGYMERRRQAHKLVHESALRNPRFAGKRVVLGDFNEWSRGLVTELLSAHLQTVDLRPHFQRLPSYPTILPFMHLDHIYFDPIVELKHFAMDRRRLAMIASDHLPLIADFDVKAV